MLVAALGATACDGDPAFETDVEAAHAGVCSGARFITYHTANAPCFSPDAFTASLSWSARPLFPPMPWETRPPGRLAGYCVFEWAPGPQKSPYPGAAALAAEIAAAYPEARVDRDCPSLQPQGSDLVADHWPQMYADFRARAGAIDGVAAPAGTPKVVTVIDTWEDATAPRWTEAVANTPNAADDHGYGLARIIEALTCGAGLPSAPCLARTRSIQAFNAAAPPHLNLGITPQPRGAHGYLSDLATAIYRATRVDDTPIGAPLPQVLNLSLGWAPIPELGGPIGDIQLGEKAAAAAVHEALQYAGCRDALVFAAAGNNHTGELGRDAAALYPAAWTTHETLDAAGCSAEFGVMGGASGRPIAQAVGAQAVDGGPLMSARQAATPALGALGLRGMAEVPGANVSTTPMSGSSVSTAVVSASAAALWSLIPSADPTVVLDMLFAHAKDLGDPARLHDGARTTRHLVQPCAVVEDFCLGSGACTMGCAGAPAGNFDPTQASVTPRSGQPMACEAPGQLSGGLPACGFGADPLDLRPHTVPQPGDIYCPVCYAERAPRSDRYALVMQIESGTPILPKFFALTDGRTSFGFDLSDYFSSSLAADLRHTVKLDGFELPAETGEIRAGAAYFEVAGSAGRSSVVTELDLY